MPSVAVEDKSAPRPTLEKRKTPVMRLPTEKKRPLFFIRIPPYLRPDLRNKKCFRQLELCKTSVKQKPWLVRQFVLSAEGGRPSRKERLQGREQSLGHPQSPKSDTDRS